MKRDSKKNINELVISSPARLHLGFFGIEDNYGYSYGSMGLAINLHKTLIKVSKAKESYSNISKKYIKPLETYLNSIGKKQKMRIILENEMKKHVGLGSGTQTALCLGKGVSKFLGLELDIENIAKIFNRGLRSGAGIGVFEKGGFIVDTCKKNNQHPQILLRKKFPSSWKIVLLSDMALRGFYGEREEKFFRNTKASKLISSELSEVVLRGIIPSIIYKDFTCFARNISYFQKLTAEFYKKKQKDLFISDEISKVIKYLSKSRTLGIGQSSWGPFSYIFTESLPSAKEVIKIIKTKFKMYNNLTYEIASAKNSGYTIKNI
ncbi:MAG: beta-ribofuranosylaminobenzene 5'-phosphate synthase family protein [Pseudomonadota bacterium]|nr:beta-ribofuranosylaminobenzene 5'-phosphate synthase family protein [Pseudomonadota bacterium]